MNSYSHIQKPDQYSSQDEIDLAAILHTLWRAKWFLLIVIIFTTLFADFYVRKSVVPFYQATAKVALEEGKVQIISDIESVMSDGPISNIGINTELEVLRSRDLISQLVNELNLTNHFAFNNSFQDPSLSTQIKSKVYTFFGIEPDKQKYLQSTEEFRLSVINSVIGAMDFSNNGKTRMINITATTIDADLSVIMANTMATLYIKNKIQVKQDALANATKFLTSRTSELKQDFEELKSKYARFSSKSEFINPAVLQSQEIQLRDLRLRVLEAKEKVLKGTDRQTKLKSMTKLDHLQTFISTANDFRLNRFFQRYTKGNISQGEFNLELNHFMQSIDSEVRREQDQLSALKISEAILENQIERQSKELNIMEQLERETESARLLYESFFTRLLEMNVQVGLETADARVLDKAVPKGAIKQRNNLIRILGGILGLILSSGIVLFQEMLSFGIRSVNNLRELTGHNVLASVPLISQRNSKSIVSYLKNKPNSVISESIRNLRTSILMSDNKQVPQIIMFSSSIPGEGKTILSFSLAQNMVGLGKKVLLIEADIRRIQHTVDINRSKTISLVDILLYKKNFTYKDLFFDELGFSILSGSRSNVNAADLFSSDNFANLLTELREYFDYIIIDTPPVLAVPDARVIGVKSDANIYVVHWGKTTRTQLDQGLEMFSSVGVKTTGLVMNQIDLRKVKKYAYEGQYAYNSYGDEYYDN